MLGLYVVFTLGFGSDLPADTSEGRAFGVILTALGPLTIDVVAILVATYGVVAFFCGLVDLWNQIRPGVRVPEARVKERD